MLLCENFEKLCATKKSLKKTIFASWKKIQYASTNIYTHLKIRQCEFYKDYSWQPNAFLERATIEDTTVTYALVNPKTKRFTSQTAKKTEYRKATHYDNDSYILEKAYYCFEHNLPSYKENA